MSVPYERFAIALALCTPSDLRAEWIHALSGNPDAATRLQAMIDDTGFTDAVRAELKASLDDFGQNAATLAKFTAVTELFITAYGGPDGCPSAIQLSAIVDAFRRLDGTK